ncbi:hypothetical protein SESBI_47485, partial [Sesbania bispinosa]
SLPIQVILILKITKHAQEPVFTSFSSANNDTQSVQTRISVPCYSLTEIKRRTGEEQTKRRKKMMTMRGETLTLSFLKLVRILPSSLSTRSLSLFVLAVADVTDEHREASHPGQRHLRLDPPPERSSNNSRLTMDPPTQFAFHKIQIQLQFGKENALRRENLERERNRY